MTEPGLEPIISIEKSLEINQPIQRVWDAVTEPDELKKWLGSDAAFSPYEGAMGFVEWQGDSARRFALQIETLSAPEHFIFSWMNEKNQDYDPSKTTQVEFHLCALTDDSTKIVIRECGFKTEAQRDENVKGWDTELADLLTYLQ